MLKKVLIIMLCSGLIFTLSACNSNGEKPSEPQTAPPDTEETETEVPTDGRTPEYIGWDAYFDVVADYILKEEGQYYDTQDVMIPIPVVQRIDDTDKENIKIWADFIIGGFSIEGDMLVHQCGGMSEGIIVLKQEGGAFTVTDYKTAEDGAGFNESLKKICEGDEDLYNKFIYAGEYRKQTEHDIISDYVRKNNIAVTSYQIGEEETPL